MSDLERILHDLAEVQDELIALPEDAFTEREAVRERQEELRAEAAKFAKEQDAGRSDAELLDELAQLREWLAEAEEQHIDMVGQAGGTGGAKATDGDADIAGINRKIDRAQGAGEIHARIGHVKGILHERGVDV